LIRLRDLVRSHFTGREGGMTTVWRPRVRIPVPDIDGADADENRRDESTKKGTKRKRAPRTKGPCEHGVKPARTARCAVLVRTVVGAVSARSAVGHQSASTVVSAARSRWVTNMQGVRWVWVTNMRARSSALSVQGVRWVRNMRARSSRSHCKECGGASICEHGRRALYARSAVGVNLRARSSALLSARSAVGDGICEHGRQRSDARSATRRNSRLVLLLNVAI